MYKLSKKYNLIFIIAFSEITYAQIWGPKNIEECILEKMKGQNQAMIYTAREACKKAFPPPPEEIQIKDDQIKWTWCESEYTSQTVCVQEKPKNIILTKTEAVFFTEKCELKQDKQGVKVEAKKNIWSDKFVFTTPSANYNCANFWFYGIAK